MNKKKLTRAEIIQKYQEHKQDTGSAQVQIALLTKRIEELAKHLRSHQKDQDSARGLLILVGKRRRFLNYIGKEDPKKYEKVIAELKLRK